MAIIKKVWGDIYQYDWNDDTWTTGTPNDPTEDLRI